MECANCEGSIHLGYKECFTCSAAYCYPCAPEFVVDRFHKTKALCMKYAEEKLQYHEEMAMEFQSIVDKLERENE